MPAKKKPSNQYLVVWPQGGVAEWSVKDGTFYHGRVATLFPTRRRALAAIQKAIRYWYRHHDQQGDAIDPGDYRYRVYRAVSAA